MRGPRPTLCIFPEDFLQEARQTIHQRTAPFQDVQRFCLVLLLQEQPQIGSEAAAAQVGLCARQVRRWRQRWAAGDFSIADLEGRGRKATFSPSGSSLGHRHRL
jgi:hypothetical protein